MTRSWALGLVVLAVAACDNEGTTTVSPELCGNGKVDTGEYCDIDIFVGEGSCPTLCTDGVACTSDLLRGVGCQAHCEFAEITAMSGGSIDNCCPDGGSRVLDIDCPATCGNGFIEAGEDCDTAITEGGQVCITSCDDGDACTTDFLTGSGTCKPECGATPITSVADGDGCCPVGANSNNDSDCNSACGNGAVETGEFCDPGVPAGLAGSCPDTCTPANACETAAITGAGCGARCVKTPIVTPGPVDGCCPTGADSGNDDDCLAVCGNGAIEPDFGESCDIGIATGGGSCPVVTDCDDAGPGSECTADALVGAGCGQRCENVEIEDCVLAADGCCPAGCDNLTDGDCSATCGNGSVEEYETCDTAITDDQDPGYCPVNCDDGDDCTADSLVGGGCNAACLNSPITDIGPADLCCPDGGNNNNDEDCQAECGNGVVESDAGETCDIAIPGDCPIAADCDDGDICSSDELVNAGTCTAACENTALEPCCGDGLVEAGEECEPSIAQGQPGACPASCTSDSDACTSDQVQNPGTCQAKCSYPDVCCGNAVIDKGETCDTAIPTGAGACSNILSVCPTQFCGTYLANGTCSTTGCGGGSCLFDYPWKNCTTVSFNDGVADGNPCKRFCDRTPVADDGTDNCCPFGMRNDQDPDCGIGDNNTDDVNDGACACDTTSACDAACTCDNECDTAGGDGRNGTCPDSTTCATIAALAPYEWCDDDNIVNNGVGDTCTNSGTPTDMVGGPCTAQADGFTPASGHCAYPLAAQTPVSGTPIPICITEASVVSTSDTVFPGGYCSYTNCDPTAGNFTSCPQQLSNTTVVGAEADAVCAAFGGGNFCFARCFLLHGDLDCRHNEDYECVPFNSLARGICVPRFVPAKTANTMY